ncbi:MAG: hypothetical protein WDA02_08015 [Saccharofermentanales bacterium]
MGNIYEFTRWVGVMIMLVSLNGTLFIKKNYSELNKYVIIHGGLTFSDFNEDKSLWIIGFDTNHYNDDINNFPYDFVLNETIYLREQCLKLKEVQRILKLNKLNNKL